MTRINTRLNNTIATSNDPWGPTGTDMADIAKITFNKSVNPTIDRGAPCAVANQN